MSAPRHRLGRVAAVTLAAAGVLAPAAHGLSFSAAPGAPVKVGAADPQLEAADLDGDGRDDLAVATSAGVVVLGSSPLAELSPFSGSPFAVSSDVGWVRIGDLNGDGRPDLVGAGDGEDVADVLLATANGSFAHAPGSPLQLESGSHPTSVAIADLNGDGVPDLAFADCGAGCGGSGVARVSLLLGDGLGGFTEAPGSPFPLGLAKTGAIVAADLNGDGHPDLIAGGDGAVAVLLGDGHGSLSPGPGSPSAIGTVQQAADLAVGDVNGDGLPDVVTANSGAHSISVLAGDGQGRLTLTGPPVPTGSTGSAQSIALADLDADGTLDAVVADAREHPLLGDVAVLLGDGRGGFAAAAGSPLPADDGASFARIGDFTGDGQPDIAVAGGADKNVELLLNSDLAEATPSAALLAFPQLALGASQEQLLTVTNTGDGFLRAGTGRITGGDFTATADGCSGARLLVGASCALTVRFQPSAGGLRAGTLELPANVSGGLVRVSLSGTGVGIPVLSSVRLVPSRFAVLRHGRPSFSGRRPRGSRLSFTLSEPSTVRVGITRVAHGRRRGGVCRLKARHGRRCVRPVRLGHLNFHLGAGQRSVTLTGMLYDHPLAPGSYTLTVIALNTEGMGSAAAKLSFRIVR